MNLRGKDAWEQAALALAAGDRAALGTVLPRLPAAAARSIRPLRNAAAVPAGVEWIGDSRFAAIFARERATVRWSLPGRELVTGCYLAQGDAAEFRLSPGECRFFVLREGADA